ncbi:hypothetical protein [Niabella ginsenosidivorans]|nr:hypothetical protein [Niabella ginsenosidivorans]
MKVKLTFVFFVLLICLCSNLSAQTVTTIATGGYYTALAYDGAGNLYTTRYDAGSDRYQVVKYVNGTGFPQVLLEGLQYDAFDYPWGLAVTGNGDVYVAASNVDNKIIKLPYNSGTNTYGTAETFVSGNYYSALAVDATGNLYTLEYAAATSDYAIVKYTAGSNSGIQLYHGLVNGPGYQYPTGIAVASNGDILVVDGFNGQDGQTGAAYRFTAASNYTARTTISSGNYSSALALDPQGNLYVSEYNGTTYVLNRYTNATGTPVKIADLELGDNFYPWGIIALNSTNIYFATGSSSSTAGGALKHLLGTPETPAAGISFTNTTDNSTTISWTNGSGVRRTVFMMAGSSGTAAPVNGTDYTANPVFGSGSQIGSGGWYAVYSGTGTTVDVTGLSATTEYRVMVIEDNGNNYYQPATGTNNPANVTTTAVLPVTFGAISALLDNGALKVKWNTESENNNDHFEVQASTDGKNFKSIGTVASKAIDGNSKVTLDYQFDSPWNVISFALLPFVIGLLGFPATRCSKCVLAGLLLLSAAVTVISCTKNNTDIKGIEKLYIRIAQVDKDGTAKFSKVVTAVPKK